jgi:hypothetical protein
LARVKAGVGFPHFERTPRGLASPLREFGSFGVYKSPGELPNLWSRFHRNPRSSVCDRAGAASRTGEFTPVRVSEFSSKSALRRRQEFGSSRVQFVRRALVTAGRVHEFTSLPSTLGARRPIPSGGSCADPGGVYEFTSSRVNWPLLPRHDWRPQFGILTFESSRVQVRRIAASVLPPPRALGSGVYRTTPGSWGGVWEFKSCFATQPLRQGGSPLRLPASSMLFSSQLLGRGGAPERVARARDSSGALHL